ncbi:MAG: 50S ribosomal protein L18 [Planctomycetaceae bacterium]|nr:MAG: 50S ribosomal protein L18 [Planctomycetaceae bacterium]
MNKQKEIELRRQRRRHHVRNRVRGTAECPRLTVHRSLQHIGVQIVDDMARKTLASASTRDRAVREEVRYGGNKSAAEIIGKIIAEKAKAIGVERVAFDRGHAKYHGRVASLANAAREAGLTF